MGLPGPGDPQLAAALAREDSCIDHYDDGVEGAEFLAAVESAAFVEQDIHRLLEIGFSFLNKEGRFYKVIRDTVDWWEELGDFCSGAPADSGSLLCAELHGCFH